MLLYFSWVLWTVDYYYILSRNVSAATKKVKVGLLYLGCVRNTLLEKQTEKYYLFFSVYIISRLDFELKILFSSYIIFYRTIYMVSKKQ